MATREARPEERTETQTTNGYRPRMKELYNNAWEQNWGFVPMTDAEIDHMASQLKPAIVPDLVRFAEVDGVAVGFGLLVPDLNIAIQKAGGRLFPFGLLRILWPPRTNRGRSRRVDRRAPRGSTPR